MTQDPTPTEAIDHLAAPPAAYMPEPQAVDRSDPDVLGTAVIDGVEWQLRLTLQVPKGWPIMWLGWFDSTRHLSLCRPPEEPTTDAERWQEAKRLRAEIEDIPTGSPDVAYAVDAQRRQALLDFLEDS